MDVKEAIMQMAIEQFKKELKDPKSKASKKFSTILYGDPAAGTKGLFDKFTEYEEPIVPVSTPTDAKSDAESELAPDASERDIDAELKRYKRSGLQIAGDVAGEVLGMVHKGVGNITKNTGSILGDALIALGQSRQGYANPLAPVATLVGSGMKIGGNVLGGASGILGEAIEAIGKDVRNNREKEREAELLLREHPNGAFYDARRKLTTGVQKGYSHD